MLICMWYEVSPPFLFPTSDSSVQYSVYSCTAPESGRRVSKTVVRVSSNETAGRGGGLWSWSVMFEAVNKNMTILFEKNSLEFCGLCHFKAK